MYNNVLLHHDLFPALCKYTHFFHTIASVKKNDVKKHTQSP